MADRPKQTSNEKTLLGQLIAEISKFGGASKEDASRLAKILLPHIDRYAEQTPQPQPAEAGKLRQSDLDWNKDTYLWTSGGSLRRKLQEFAHRYIHADSRADQESLTDDLIGAIEGAVATHLRAELQALREKLADSTLYADGGIRRYDDYGVPMLRVDDALAALDEVISKYGSEGT